MPTLHVIIPFFNEERTLEACVRRVLQAPLPDGWERRVVLVDDCSAPSARAAAECLRDRLSGEGHEVQLLRHERNRGKGAAIRTGIDAILGPGAFSGADVDRPGDVAIVQDADLEYDPADFARLLAPLIEGRADAVYGNRWGEAWRRARRTGGLRRRVHRLGNAALTAASNWLTGLRLDDMECCYKLLPLPLLRRVRPHLTEERFGIEPQITAVLARLGQRVAQVDVQYAPRGFSEGKKIGVRDAVRALWVLLRERLRRADEAAPAHAETAGLTRRRIMLQILGFLAGLGLIVWCVRTAADGEGWDRVLSADRSLIAGLLLSTVASLVINAAMFWTALWPVHRHSIARLTLLNAVAGLFNYAPVRLGLVARIAYNLRVDRLGARVVAAWMLATGGIMVLALLSTGAADVAIEKPGVLMLLAIVALLAVAKLVIRVALPLPPVAAVAERLDGLETMLVHPVSYWGTAAMRLADIGAFTARMWFAARIIGLSLGMDEVLLLAVTAQLVSLSPLGRLGFREAAVAFAAARLEGGLGEADVASVFAQLAIVESAGEAAVLIPAGVLATPWYAWSMRRARTPVTTAAPALRPSS